MADDSANGNGSQTKVTIALLGQSIESLRVQIQDGFADIKRSFHDMQISISTLETRVRCLETSYATGSNLRDEKLRNLATTFDDLDKRIERVEDSLPGLKQAVKILSYIGSILAAAVIGLIWKLITGEIQISP